MSQKEIPDSAIELVAKHINTRNNKNYGIPAVGNSQNLEAAVAAADVFGAADSAADRGMS